MIKYKGNGVIMEVEINGINIVYEKSGTGDQVMVLMHGWGQSSMMMEPIANHFNRFFTVYNYNFPGFGGSDHPKTAYSTIDYTNDFKLFLDRFKITDPILVGHSFGCRIALRFASENVVKKMVLTGAAGLKSKRGLDYYAKVYSYKLGKQIRKIPMFSEVGANKKVGSSDYQALDGIMRATFVKVVNEDIKPCLSKIKAETLLVYGSNDDATPLWMGQYYEKHLPNAGLAVFENDDHYAYYHQMDRFLRVMDIFLDKEIK
ncbi:MAG: alpha/beta hydrolase [Erysipelotrichaceae bacterium]